MWTLADLRAACERPVKLLFDPGQRLFWAYLATSLLIAVVVAMTIRPRGGVLRALFARRVWLHRSSKLDVQLLIVKGAIISLVLGPLVLSSGALSVSTFLTLDKWLGIREPLALPRGAACALYTATLFVAWDASRYLLHRLAHTVPALWELHKVHHSARVMTPLTLYRGHPIESYLFMLRGALVSGLVTGLFMHLCRSNFHQLDILGVNALGFVFNLAGGNLRHSHVQLRYGRWVERLLISPAQHQIHHSARPEQCHSNYGSWLAIWDWLGGSLQLSRPRQRLRFGLRDEHLNHRVDHLGSALFAPLWAALRRCAAIRASARRPG